MEDGFWACLTYLVVLVDKMARQKTADIPSVNEDIFHWFTYSFYLTFIVTYSFIFISFLFYLFIVEQSKTATK